MHFAKLDDSPMFRKQIQSLEENAESLRERTLKFCKGSRKYTEGLGEAYDGDIAFASSLETFGGGHNDPVGVAFGGPVMTKFTIALREIGTYKEVLRSQVEHMLNDRLMQFVNIDLNDVKEARKRFDRTCLLYDQAREKYLSIRKSTRSEIASVLEEELHSARSSFEQARFNLITVVSNVEAKKRFEFLEAVSGTMDAHLRYFKQGYELLHQMEPYIHQVLTYAQQSRERSNCEQSALTERMQEFKRQIDREIRWSSIGSLCSPNGDGMQSIGRSSHKMIEAVMQLASKGKVQTIRQGYLSKRSTNLRGDWKRRFFVLDSRGMLYYYRKQGGRQSGSSSQPCTQRGHHSSELSTGLLGRWLSSHYHSGVHDENSVAHHTVNLLTSTIKVDSEQSDLRFCFRIISPSKIYTLQAESALDQMDWIEKITGVIASLLSSHTNGQHLSPKLIGNNQATSEASSIGSYSDHDHHSSLEESSFERSFNGGRPDRSGRGSHHQCPDKPIVLLRNVHGNNVCADCGSPDPDWASLNLGLLVCIECSGVHRNLGVHISKVRSLTLDVKIWEPSVIMLFQSLGNTFVNSVWEKSLPVDTACTSSSLHEKQHQVTIHKPNHTDPISFKEKFIQAKYAEKLFIQEQGNKRRSVDECLWDSVYRNDKKSVYTLLVVSGGNINLIHRQTQLKTSLSLAKKETPMHEKCSGALNRSHSCEHSSKITLTNSLSDDKHSYHREFLDGCTLLHVACHTADIGMIELLLQYGADTNATDIKGRTPLHHCTLEGKSEFAKLLLTRGANPQVVDFDGKKPSYYATDMRNITDAEVLLMLEYADR